MSIEIKGAVCVHADREVVWEALYDVEAIALCVPGCERLSHVGADGYALAAKVGLGPVKVGFGGTVRIVRADGPSRMVLEGRGGGGIAGSARGSLVIDLAETPAGCRVAYRMQAEVFGPIAGLAPTFLSGIASTLTGLFARRFATVAVRPTPSRTAPVPREQAFERVP